MSQVHAESIGNRLLNQLPREEYERLLPHLEQVFFALGEVVYESGGQMAHIYFPTTAIVSLLYTMENGTSGGNCSHPDLFRSRIKGLPT